MFKTGRLLRFLLTMSHLHSKLSNRKKETLITPNKSWSIIFFKEIREYQDLFYYLTLRDFKVRYKQTFLGVAWLLLQPLSLVLIFSVFFGRLGHIPTNGIPYPLFSISGILIWTFFSKGITQVGQCLIADTGLIKKVYFPRLIIPLSSLMAVFIDFLCIFCVYILGFLLFGYMPSYRLLIAPFYFCFLFLITLGIGAWLAALNLFYRDFRNVMPLLLQAWMFMSPIIYSVLLVEGNWKYLFSLNPLVGLIELFRWITIPIQFQYTVNVNCILISCFSGIVMLILGLCYFKKTEAKFADFV